MYHELRSPACCRTSISHPRSHGRLPLGSRFHVTFDEGRIRRISLHLELHWTEAASGGGGEMFSRVTLSLFSLGLHKAPPGVRKFN